MKTNKKHGSALCWVYKLSSKSVYLLHHYCDVMSHRPEEEGIHAQVRRVILWCLIAKLHRHLLAWNAYCSFLIIVFLRIGA